MEKYGDILREVWGENNQDIVDNLVRSMPGRVQAVIGANGDAIPYSFWFDIIIECHLNIPYLK